MTEMMATSSKIGKFFLDFFIFYLDNTNEIYFDNFFGVTHENEKIILTRPHAFVQFENGSNAKNG